MHIKTVVSAAVLAAALGFSGAAVAQTMIGNQTVSEGDMERVKVYCEDLQTKANGAVGTSEDSMAPTEDSINEDGGTTLGMVEISAVTLETCLEGGFITEPVAAPQ